MKKKHGMCSCSGLISCKKINMRLIPIHYNGTCTLQIMLHSLVIFISCLSRCTQTSEFHVCMTENSEILIHLI